MVSRMAIKYIQTKVKEGRWMDGRGGKKEGKQGWKEGSSLDEGSKEGGLNEGMEERKGIEGKGW